jgi:inorganic pyrophosphatase
MNPNDCWQFLERLVTRSRVIIDCSKGSRHPHCPEIVFPLDYGYLFGASPGDGSGIDLWTGASGTCVLP